jgi:hypothetical protein
MGRSRPDGKAMGSALDRGRQEAANVLAIALANKLARIVEVAMASYWGGMQTVAEGEGNTARVVHRSWDDA